MPYDRSRDLTASRAAGASSPARRAMAVTPSDAADLDAYARSLYVGGAGDVKVVPVGAPDDTGITFKDHPVGYMPVQVRRVCATGTTATQILALS